MSRGIRFQAEEIKYLLGTAVTGAYQALADSTTNTLLNHVTRQIVLVNDTDGVILVSFDGITDHVRLDTGQGLLLDVASNRMGESDEFALAINSSVYVKDSNLGTDTGPTSGIITLSSFYAYGDGVI